MLKGLALTPPVLGRIAIGRIVVKDGKRLPQKEDEFTITTQVQTREGWLLHPLDQALRPAKTAPDGKKAEGARGKLRAIPVQLLFNDPDLSLRSSYSAFDRVTGRPICVGNGETCRRSTSTGVQSLPCPSPAGCDLAEMLGCKPFGRLNVRIGEEDELGTFIFRTSGYNSIRTLATRLRYFQALAGDALSSLLLELRLRGKSTAQSHRAPIFYVDLTLRTGSTLAHSLESARADRNARHAMGFDQAALDQAAREGFAAGAFEESVEEGPAVVEEFHPQDEPAIQTESEAQQIDVAKPKLAAKLNRLVEASAALASAGVAPR